MLTLLPLSNSAQLFTHEARVIYEQCNLWLLLLQSLGSYERIIHLQSRPSLLRAAQQGYTKGNPLVPFCIFANHICAHIESDGGGALVWCTAAAAQPLHQVSPLLASRRVALLLAMITAVKGHRIAARTF
jgi:hypothetical protein